MYNVDSYTRKSDYYTSGEYWSGAPIGAAYSISTAGWYRFAAPAGTRMPTSSPDAYRCGTMYGGWLAARHPAVGEPVVKEAKVCFPSANNDPQYACNWETTTEV